MFKDRACGNVCNFARNSLPPEYRQFVRGYAVTSYASQGKTVDYVLFSDSCIKAATNAKQWYVTISRGRLGVKIFTTNKEQLRKNVTASGKRELALDLVHGNVEAIVPSRNKRRFYGYSTLQSLIQSITQSYQITKPCANARRACEKSPHP